MMCGDTQTLVGIGLIIGGLLVGTFFLGAIYGGKQITKIYTRGNRGGS